ncbi:uncharacterized protein LOC126278808 [Schistocerca gregaria]|uniref:uncharacterized protein LOC126278808 n=1 Tax=Schistocerca gregaria TaxID=7010 RepID=UPI00211EE012|nr:uncharacterized protein LOC126278808 [Schistocerca gregaria]
MKYEIEESTVKKKIKNLRSAFHREHSRVTSTKSDSATNLEDRKWFAYESLKFILDVTEPRAAMASTVVIDEGETDHSNADVVNELCTPSVSFVTSVAKPEPRMKKIKLDPIARQKDPLHITHSFSERSSSKSEQEIPTIVKVWCEKLLTLDPQQRIFAEKAINDVLFEASLGTLHRHSVTINSSPLLSSPSVSLPRKTFCASCSASLAVGTKESSQEAKDTEKDSTS